MKKDESISRRSYIKRTVALGATALATVALSACSKSDNNNAGKTATSQPQPTAKSSGQGCNDSASLTSTQKQERASVNYMEASPLLNKECDNCMHYVAGKKGGCGTCQVVPGPINPKGYCVLYHPA